MQVNETWHKTQTQIIPTFVVVQDTVEIFSNICINAIWLRSSMRKHKERVIFAFLVYKADLKIIIQICWLKISFSFSFLLFINKILQLAQVFLYRFTFQRAGCQFCNHGSFFYVLRFYCQSVVYCYGRYI